MTATETARAGGAQRARSGVLAVALQEVFTGVVRVQTNRQTATDSAVFRDSIKQLLRTAHANAASAGMPNEDIKLAIFAVVVLLDEAVLNSTDPVLAGWSRQPLQEELFGGHTGGTVFFENLHALLARQESEYVADVLEVYGTCLQLGFRGQYGRSGVDDLRRWTQATLEKVARIRGGGPVLAPDGLLPANETIPVAKDPWMGRLVYATIGLAVVFIVLWVVFRFVLVPSWVSDLRAVRPAP
jgi:type VI secretion system protein ImpK